MLRQLFLAAVAAVVILPVPAHGATVSIAERNAENQRWQKLGVTVPAENVVRPDPFASPYDNRSFVVPFSWYASYYQRLRAKQTITVSASALRQDLPILRLVLSKAYSGYSSAETAGWNWNAMFEDWDRSLQSAGNADLSLESAFAPWGRLEKLQLDNHSGVPGLRAFISGSRSAMLMETPATACTALNFPGGTKQQLAEHDPGQQPHAVYVWRGTLQPAYYVSYPKAIGSASSIACGPKMIPLTTVAGGPVADEPPRFVELSPGVAYLRMPTFTDANDEAIRAAVKAAAQLSADPLVIFDLRDNDGGNAPLDVLAQFIGEKTLAAASQLNQEGTKSCFRTGLFFGLQQQLAANVAPPIDAALHEQLQSMLDSLKGRATPNCTVEAAVSNGGPSLSAHRFTPGSRTHFLVLVNDACGSDCEYITYVLGNVPGTVIAGESTYGVMGFTQPGYTVLPHSRIPFRVALSRTNAYGDGRSVDGYGITADILLPDTDSQSLQSLTALAKNLLQSGSAAPLR